MVLQAVVAIPFATGGAAGTTVADDAEYLAVATIVSAAGGTLLVLLLARGARSGHLALRRPVPRETCLWVVGALALGVATTCIGVLLDRPAMPQWWLDAYASAVAPLLLVSAVVLAAPVFEEVLWRGLVFGGWSLTRLGSTGTILLTAALWTALHAQYDAYDLAQVFVFGILLGFARHRTGSLLVPIAMHAANNLATCVQADWMLQA